MSDLNNIKFFDGAFGTYYFSKTLDQNPCELANINNPEIVGQIHKEYLDDGAQAIKTNTFSANPYMFPDKNQLNEIIKNGYNIAKNEAIKKQSRVFADIGYIKPEQIPQNEIEEQYCIIAQSFLNCGATDFLFETFCDYKSVVPAISLIKSTLPDSTVIISFAVSPDGYTKKGLFYKSLLYDASANDDIDAVGLNCVCGPTHMLDLIKGIEKPIKPLLAMPNSGYPSLVNGRTVFRDNEDYFSEKLCDIIKNGASIVGGCCGTTPKHIKLAIVKIKKQENNFIKTNITVKSQKESIHDLNINNSIFDKKDKIIAVELDPPATTDFSFLIDSAKKLKSIGADIITIADSPLARSRADSILSASIVKRSTDIDVLPHISCRDRNQIAIKGALLGAAYEHINKILVVTGDPIMSDVYSKRNGVYCFNSKELISYINSLNKDVFADCPFLIGGALNVNVKKFDLELKRAQKKIENGATFLLTQPIFSEQAIDNLIKAKNTLNCKIFGGILPIASYKNAIFLNNEVTGIHVPDEICEMVKDAIPEQVVDISAGFCLDIMKKISDYCDGYYIMTPLRRINIILKLLGSYLNND